MFARGFGDLLRGRHRGVHLHGHSGTGHGRGDGPGGHVLHPGGGLHERRSSVGEATEAVGSMARLGKKKSLWCLLLVGKHQVF